MSNPKIAPGIISRGAFIAAYSIVATVSIFIALEIITRVFCLAPTLPPNNIDFVRNSGLPFREKPNSIGHSRHRPRGNEFYFEHKTNSEGFRDIEHDIEKPKSVFRILTVGDSYTAGSGAPVGRSYPFQLGKFLNERLKGNPPIEVINVGQGRYWPEPERILLENIGIKFSPDLILVEFTPNDVTDTYLGINFNSVRDGYLISREGNELGNAGVWLYVHSHLFRKIIRAYLEFKLKYLASNNISKMKWGDVFVPNGYHEKDWQRVELEYERMIDIAHSIKSQIAFVYIPSHPFEGDYASNRLVTWGKQQRVSIINTLPVLNEAAKTEKVYWIEDIHCTEAGYRCIAETVCSKIIIDNWVKSLLGHTFTHPSNSGDLT